MLSKFFLAVALSIPIAAGGLAHAATITPNADGKTLRVQVDSPSDTFGGILRRPSIRGPCGGRRAWWHRSEKLSRTRYRILIGYI